MVRKSRLTYVIILAIVVFLSRVPFLGNGFGLDPDAWRIANTARRIALSGDYSYSRPPGYPILELFYSLLSSANPTTFNTITAIFSAGVFIFFALTLAKINCKRYLLGALALVFIPVVYINSTTSMDYVWALFFILGSYYYALDNKPFIAGIFLGLAIGCRITSAAMVIPIGITMYNQDPTRAKSVRTFLVCAILLGMATYIPVISVYRLNFLTFAEHGYPSFLTIIKRASIDVWGVIGSSVILIVLFVVGSRLQATRNFLKSRDPVFLTSSMAIIIYILIYARLPHEAGYLIPALPFVILLIYKFLNHKWFTGICILLIISSFVLSINNRQFKLEGAIVQDRASRMDSIQFARSVFVQASRLSKNSIIVSGYFLPQLEYYLYKSPVDGVNFVYLLGPNELEGIIAAGESQLYYLPGIDSYTIRIYGVNLSDFGGMPLIPQY